MCDPELSAIVFGRPVAGSPARLKDHVLHHPNGEGFASIVPFAGAWVDGEVVELEDRLMDRLRYYCGVLGCTFRKMAVMPNDETVAAEVACAEQAESPSSTVWSFDDWQARTAKVAREAAAEIMRLMETHSIAQAIAILTQIKMRAASRVRARTRPTPDVMEPRMKLSNVEIMATRQPYTDYFAVREDDLRFPTFDGGKSTGVTRATFLGGDAVTVLPYDPALDCVLVIRQFRHGVFARGDAHPWLIEPAAGRIDPNEEPETTALRELHEETGIDGAKLHLVARYYPSPSAYSEYIFSYVAIADLSGRDGTTSGLESENEDIMSHVIPFERLMELVSEGAANTAPLILSAFWLAGRRASLRASD
ncbi:MAG: NUDIX domain-containing protein [Silicimonas sp.]|nr:NUDIX domain-containing protein [Silicimonas sp.]